MPNPVSAAIGIGGTLLSSKMNKDAAQSASGAQSYAAELGIQEQQAAREEMRKLLEPYTQAGQGALGGIQALSGLGGPGAERSAIDAISQSPTMMAMMRQGEDAILQNASATGGLRGGNTQAALAQFRPAMLAQEINNRFSRMGGIAQMGQNSAAGVGSNAMQGAAMVGNLLQQQGAAQAGGAMAGANAFGQGFSGLMQAGGMWAGMGKQFPWQASGSVSPQTITTGDWGGL